MLQQSKEELKEMSLIEVAFQIFDDKGEAITFQALLDELSSTLGLSDEEMREKMVQFYTDLNIDGRFMTLGENRWGLREWYPIDQIDEEVVMPTKTKKKKTKKAKKEEEDILEDLDEEELDYDLDDEDEDLLDDDEEEEDESLEALREEELEEDEDEFDEDLIDDDDKEYELDDDEEEEEEEEEE